MYAQATRRRHGAIDGKWLQQALDFLTESREAALRVPGRTRRDPVQRALRQWLGHPAIRACGLACGRREGELVFKIYVDRGQRRRTSTAPAIPRRITVPGLPERLSVQVETFVRLRPNAGIVGPFSCPELSIMRELGGTGTAGCVVARPGSPHLYVLSCAHVMAWEGISAAAPEDPIKCPAVVHSGKAAPNSTEIARLKEWSPALSPFTLPGDLLRVDAAYAQLNNAGRALAKQFGVPLAYTDAITPGASVEFRGARSGPRSSKVKCLLTVFPNGFNDHRGASTQINLRNLVVCEPCSDVGDSGSAVYFPKTPSGSGRILIGLVIAGTRAGDGTAADDGSDLGSGTVICRIQEVFDRFGLDLVGNVFGAGVAAALAAEPNSAVPVAVGQPGMAQPTPASQPTQPHAATPPAVATTVIAPPAVTLGSPIDKVNADLVVKVFKTQVIRDRVTQFWPSIKQAMIERGLSDAIMVAMALATIFTEDATFDLVDEAPTKSNSSDLNDPDKLYDAYDKNPTARILGNTEKGDGSRYHGRGFIQLTGRWNYGHYGDKIKVELLTRPNEANVLENAANLLAWYLAERQTKIRAALRQTPPDYAAARFAVNGGLNGLAAFTAAYQRCWDLL